MKKFIMLFSLALVGCQTGPSLDERLQTYVGQPTQVVVSKMGPPSSVQEYGSSKWLVYDYNGGATAWTNPYSGQSFATQMSCRVTFEVRSEIVSNWRYAGNSCR